MCFSNTATGLVTFLLWQKKIQKSNKKNKTKVAVYIRRKNLI